MKKKMAKQLITMMITKMTLIQQGIDIQWYLHCKVFVDRKY